MALGDLDLKLKPHKLELFLAKPDKTIIAKLKEAYSKNHTVKLGNINELTFSVPYDIEIGHEWQRNPHVDMVRDRYLIKAKIGTNEDWYVIMNTQEEMDEGIDVKKATAYLLPYEMSGKTIRTFKYESLNLSTVMSGGTALDTTTGKPEIIDGILKSTKWSLGYVDASFNTKFRAFDFSSSNVLDAIFRIAETFNALIIWDTENRKISFYNPLNYGINRGLTINYGHYLKTLSRETKGDEMTTRMKVFGKDSLSIQRVSITGQNYLEDYSYFLYPFQRDINRNVIKSSYYMSDALCHAILDYTAFVATKQGEFDSLLNQRKANEMSRTTKEEELSALNGQLDIIKNDLDIANYYKNVTTQILANKTAKETEIKNKQKEIDDINTALTTINNNIQTLRTSLSYNSFFTPELIIELNDYIIEKEWVNDNIDIDSDLYEEAKKQFEKVKIAQFVININMVNFLEVIEAQRDWSKLNLGDTITIKYEKMNVNVTAKIIEYSVNHEDRSITITIANTKDILTDEEKLVKMIYSSSVASARIDMSKFDWDGISTTRSEVEQLINSTWDATKRKIEAGVSANIEISPRGITSRDLSDVNSYLVITNGLLAITNDNGNSWKHAITKDGIIAERLFGKLIAGVNLTIDASDASGTKMFTVDSNAVTILGSKLIISGGLPANQLDPTFKNGLVNLSTAYNGVVIDSTNGLVITKTDNSVRTVLNATDGFRFQKNVSGTWTDKLSYDATSGNMVVDGSINARELKINGTNVLVGNQISGTAIDKIKAEQIDVTTAKITTAQIETLTVGTNVIMGANATISWTTQVTNKPVIPTVPGYIQSTYIDSTEIRSPSIKGGTITSDTTITVGTNLTVGNRIDLTGSIDKTIVFGGVGDITFKTNGTLAINALNTVVVSVPVFQWLHGGVYENVATQEWARANVLAKFG